MAGKNTAAYGLYSDRVQVEEAIDAFVKARFRPEDISGFSPTTKALKILHNEKNTVARKVLPLRAAPAARSAARLASWLELGLVILVSGPIAAGPIVWRWPVWVREVLWAV
jgi:hypothetical protein